MLKPDTVYGFANHDEVEEAIAARVIAATTKRIREELLLEAISALVDINQSIPVQSRHRHLVAGALENFANGKAS